MSRVDPSTIRRIGIDLGGTNALGVALDASGAVVDEHRRDTPRGTDSLDALIDVLVELAVALGHSADTGSRETGSRETGSSDAGSLGVGVPGLVTADGVLRAAPNLDGVADFDVRHRLTERLRGTVVVDNDATCAAVAEWRSGAGVGIRNMVLLTLGTGIGGGIVSNGVMHRGANGFAGEFGHMVVAPDGPPCPCGRRGCWERYASGSGLARLAQSAAMAGDLDTVVVDAGGDPIDIRGEHVHAAALRGDPGALAVIDDFARWVALGLSNLTNAFDPEMFVIAGGLASGGDLFLRPIVRWLGELLYQSHLRPVPRVEFAEWGPLAGAVGAAMLPGL